jgi:hypothetical protein
MAGTVKATKLGDEILTSASALGGATWKKIENATRFYVRGFAQSIEEIARGVATGDISQSDAKLYARNALFGFAQMVADVSQIIYYAVETFLNKVIDSVKGLINRSLPVAIL